MELSPNEIKTQLQLLRSTLATLAGLLGQEILVDVGQDTTLGNSNVAKELVQLLIVTDRKLKMARNDTSLLVVARSVSSQLENFGCEVLENRSKIDRGASTNTLSIVPLPQKTVDTTDGKCETGLGRTTLRGLAARSFSTFAS